MNANLAATLYLISGVLFILALRGLSSPTTSQAGNRNGMIGMAIAVGTAAIESWKPRASFAVASFADEASPAAAARNTSRASSNSRGESAACRVAAHASSHDQGRADPLPGTVVAPAIEIPLHGRARRKVSRQGAPLATGPQQIENGIDNRAQITFARPTQSTRRRQQRRDLSPLFGSRIACVAQFVAPILRAGDFTPHLVRPSLFGNNTESQPIEITQFFSNQPLRRREAPSRRTRSNYCSGV